MRLISSQKISDTVAKLCANANITLRADVVSALQRASYSETNSFAKRALEIIIENATIADSQRLAICQDTGMAVVFVEIGKDILIKGKNIQQAIQEGVSKGYRMAYLRNSIIKDPLRFKKQSAGFGPAVIHYEYNNSHYLKLTVLPKGFGCENKSKLKMFLPTADFSSIREFILEAVKEAGPDACPPYIIGVGIGGTADYAALLAKKALLEKITKFSGQFSSDLISKLEKNLLQDINHLGIGPMGLGGKTTALAVKILTYPTHIAGLPVAVNICCHALRSATEIL